MFVVTAVILNLVKSPRRLGEVAQDAMVAQYQKDGQVGPPPGAYSPRLQRDLGKQIQRLAPKGEGFGSAGELRGGLKAS